MVAMSNQSPLDYFSHRPEKGPRISRLAIAVMVFSLLQGVLILGPIGAFIRDHVCDSLQTAAILAIPAGSVVASIVALLRIISSMDRLRGEGFAITGIVASIVLVVLIATVS